MLNFRAVMTYTNDFESFSKSVEGIKTLYNRLTIIDNSINKPVKKYYPHASVIETPISITCSQCFNHAQDIARKHNADVLIMMHSDIEIHEELYLSHFLDQIEKLVEDKIKDWGVYWTTYDSLAAFNMDTCDVLGPWDQNITHYPIDVDYYFRMRKHGFQCLDFGGHWIEHHPSATIRKNIMMDHVNLIHTNDCNNSYYEKKWGGCRDQEKYVFPFNGQDLNRQYLKMIQNPIYEKLLNSYKCGEGAFLYDQTEQGRLSQFSLLLNILNAIKPKNIIETGTNKYMFPYFLSNFIDGFHIKTFDINSECLKIYDILEPVFKKQGITMQFVCGDTRDTLSDHLNYRPDLAWVDGGHDYNTCFNDLLNIGDMETPYILVDDSKNIPTVMNAIISFLDFHKGNYYLVKNPYWDYDPRGISILRRKRMQ